MNTRYVFGIPFVRVKLLEKEIEAIVDTGFNASLLIPNSIITELGLLNVGSARYGMADGRLPLLFLPNPLKRSSISNGALELGAMTF